MSEQDSDLQLVKMVQNGNKNAFNLLVTKYQYKVVSIAQKFVSDPTEAQDIAQEAFIKAYRALADFRGDSAFYTWLYRITSNVAINYVTSHSHKVTSIDIDTPNIEAYEGAQKLHTLENPENIMEKDDTRRIIHEAVQELPLELRQAIILREIEEMSYEDIAKVANCPIGTVRSRIFRAREMIEERLVQSQK